jgi:hypothetical protein
MCSPACVPPVEVPNKVAVAKRYVWYVSYGSNLRWERFKCYIQGGTPPDAKQEETGCRDTTLPVKDDKIGIPYQLFFAEHSNNWGGAIAFIGHEKTATNPTIGRIYLITEDQFRDVVKQENGNKDAGKSSLLDLREVRAKTRITFLYEKSDFYGTIVYLGEKDGFPMYTFTASREHGNYKAPSVTYLRTICRGLQQLGFSAQDAAEYLYNAPGVQPTYTVDEIKRIYLTE